MCGRFTLSSPGEIVADLFHLGEVPDLTPRFNVAPTQRVAVVVAPEPDRRKLVGMRWGLVPSWAKDVKIGARMINARSETVATKPAFRSAFKRRRCLVVADGFYEWKRVGKAKQPFHIRMADGSPFGMAAIWEVWQPDDGERVVSCSILTTTPNALVADVHDRMPVILPPERHAVWLDTDLTDRDTLSGLLRPFAADSMCAVPVDRRVGNVRNDDPGLIEPLAETGT